MRLKKFEQPLRVIRVALVTILAREMRLNFFWSRPSFGDVASAASHDIGARNAIEIFWSRPSFGDVASAASHDMGARNAIEIFSSRPSFGDVASGASHDIGARNAIEILQQLLTAPAGLCQNDVSAWVAPAKTWRWLGQPMPKRRSDTNLLVPWEVVVIMSSHQVLSLKRLKYFEVDQRFEMLRVALVTILAREMRLKFFWSWPTFGDVASATSHDIGAINASRPSFGEVASGASHYTGARNAIEIFWSRPSFGDVAGASSHDMGARNAIENFLKSTKLWRCCECR